MSMSYREVKYGRTDEGLSPGVGENGIENGLKGLGKDMEVQRGVG